jgi:hypothetical protein
MGLRPCNHQGTLGGLYLYSIDTTPSTLRPLDSTSDIKLRVASSGWAHSPSRLVLTGSVPECGELPCKGSGLVVASSCGLWSR